eukprot:TRINITY_DN539_c0_g1_i4.p3 TRINITY_DN539_c0_g1~~TRINITY_DN539_c0_g1_i4.p3  ORF type:complete len:224 (+),score=43.29 TRINITY_DN539_c0_g1_i4:91-672(+)
MHSLVPPYHGAGPIYMYTHRCRPFVLALWKTPGAWRAARRAVSARRRVAGRRCPHPVGRLLAIPPTAPVHRRWGATGGGHARPAYATSPLSHMPPPTTTAGTAAVATPPVAAAHKPTAAAVEATPPTTGEAAAAPAAAVAKPPAAATPQTSAVAVAADAAAPAMRGSGPGSVDVAAVVEAGTDDASSSRWTTE